MSYLTVTLTARGREPHNLELLPCTVTSSSLFAHVVLDSPQILHGYILPPFEKTSSRCSKTLTYHTIIKLTITQMHTHFTQLYIAGNFPHLTDVVRISGREWGPTRPSHHLNLFPFMLFCHCGQSKQCLTKCNVFPISKCPAFPCTLLKVNPVLCN